MTKHNRSIQKIFNLFVILFIASIFFILPRNVFAQYDSNSQITIVKYSSDSFETKTVDSAQKAKNMVEKGYITWIDIPNGCNQSIADDFVKIFNLSEDIATDITNTQAIPQLKDFDDYLFIVLKTLDKKSNINQMQLEQVNMLWSKDYIITFRQKEDNEVHNLIQLIESRVGNKSWSDYQFETGYLSYIIMDTFVDRFFIGVELIADQLDEVEKQALDHNNPSVLEDIYLIKREITAGRKVIWPMRNILNYLTSYKYPLVSSELKNDLLNTYENLNYLNETAEMLSLNTSETINLYISSTNYHTNNILRFLTIVSTVLFILSFMAAIYGVNLSQFHPMEKRKRGHTIVIIAMCIMALILLFFFWTMNWI